MDTKELNDTLIAHQIMEFAMEISRTDRMNQLDVAPGTKPVTKPLETFLPQAIKRYNELRAAIKAGLA